MKLNELNELNELNKNIKKFTPWMIWILSALFYFYENLLQVSPSIMTQDLIKTFSIDKTGLSLLASFYFYAYASIQIPAGVLIDNYNIRNILLYSILNCLIGSLVFINSTDVYQASFGRILVGLGSGFSAICSMKLAGSWFSQRKFSFFVGLMVTIGMAGSIVAEGPLSLLVDKVGWKEAMNYVIFLGVILFIATAYVIKENPSQAKNIKGKSKADKKIFNGLRAVFTCKKSWLLASYAGLMFAPTVIMGGLWGVPFIQDFYSIEKPIAAGIVSVLFLGWIVGGPISGLLSEHMNTKLIMKIGTLGALVLICLILYYKASSLIVLSFLFFMFGFFSSCFLPAFSLIKELHPPANSGVVLGFMNTANTLGGAIGLSLIGFLFKINWANILEGGISNLHICQINLSILPIILLTSSCIIFFYIEDNPTTAQF